MLSSTSHTLSRGIAARRIHRERQALPALASALACFASLWRLGDIIACPARVRHRHKTGLHSQRYADDGTPTRGTPDDEARSDRASSEHVSL